MSAREAIARAIYEHIARKSWASVPAGDLELWGGVADVAMAAFLPPTEAGDGGREPTPYTPDDHFPWWYMHGGVLCACGDPMDSEERCALMRAYEAGRESLQQTPEQDLDAQMRTRLRSWGHEEPSDRATS